MNRPLRPTMPTYEQVLQLPQIVRQTVPPEFLDENGHMNIQHYMRLGAQGLGDLLDMGQHYVDARGQSAFTAEHHLTYLDELRLGDTLSVHVRLLERSDKVLHAMAFILNHSTRTMAFTFESTIIHIDLETRRPNDFPDDVARLIDRHIADQSALSWPAPVCGSMGIRRQ